MEPLQKLRKLIWDPNSEVFTDTELQEFLTDSRNNVYRAAALCLNIVRADPGKLRSFAAFTYEDLDNAIKYYERIGRGSGSSSISLKKVY